MKNVAKCRPREVPDAYPFTGNDDDADAIRILLDLGLQILNEGRPHQSDTPLGKFLSLEQIEAVARLNHAYTYLDNRAEYAKIADEARGYLVIE